MVLAARQMETWWLVVLLPLCVGGESAVGNVDARADGGWYRVVWTRIFGRMAG